MSVPQQWRLFPYLAAVYVLNNFLAGFFEDFVQFTAGVVLGDKSDRQADLGREIHALACATKALVGFVARDGIQECREACGGHGYLQGVCAVVALYVMVTVKSCNFCVMSMKYI